MGSTHLGLDREPVPDAYFVRTAEGPDFSEFHSTLHSQGAWQPGEQHMAAASGLLIHEIERRHPREDVAISRISFDILGVIHGGRFTIETAVLRPGRTIELIEATLAHDGRAAIRARVWRLVLGDTAHLAGADLPSLPPPAESQPSDVMTSVWAGGFIASLDALPAGDGEPGVGRIWLRHRHPLVLDEPSPGIAPVIGLVDVANGIALKLDPHEYLYPNVDLDVHLFRTPAAGMLGIEARVSIGPDGRGLTSSVLHDQDGPFGTAAQSLTVRNRA